MKILNSIKALLMLLLMISLVGCSDSDNNSTEDDSYTLNGTVATGAAFSGVVNITDSTGEQILNVPIETDGTYTVNIGNLTPPLMVQAIPTDSSMATLYSYVSSANLNPTETIANINVTPLTSLAVYMAAGETDLTTYFSNWGANSANFSEQVLTQAQATINANLQQQYSNSGIDYTSYDFFSTPFSADSTGIDAVLDVIDVDLSNGINVTVTGNLGFAFNASIDTTGISFNNQMGTKYSIGGTVNNASGTITLQMNGGSNYDVSASEFTFPVSLSEGAEYQVTVLTNPDGQTCSVSNGSGVVSNSNIIDISVSCIPTGGGATYKLSGSITGHTGALSFELTKNGSEVETFTDIQDSSYQSTLTFDSTDTYTISISSHPTGQLCSLSSESGTFSESDLASNISCENTYSIGGTISGASGGMTVQLNSGYDTSVSDTSFTFQLQLLDSDSYAVTVLTPPTDQTCTVSNGSGTISSANVSNISIICTDNISGGGNNTVQSATLSVNPAEYFDFETGTVSSSATGADIIGVNNEGVNFGNEGASGIVGRRLYRLSVFGSLSAIPSFPVWSDAAPWVAVSYDFTDGTGGLPIAVGELWAVYTSDGNYAVMEITGLPGGNFGSSFTFDYIIQ